MWVNVGQCFCLCTRLCTCVCTCLYTPLCTCVSTCLCAVPMPRSCRHAPLEGACATVMTVKSSHAMRPVLTHSQPGFQSAPHARAHACTRTYARARARRSLARSHWLLIGAAPSGVTPNRRKLGAYTSTACILNYERFHCQSSATDVAS